MADYKNVPMSRIVWMFWHDWTEAPDIAAKSVISWRVNNPGWTVRALSWSTIERWLDKDFIKKVNALDIVIQHKSDLIRLELIHRYGGVWADATSFCAWPLDDWIHDCTEKGFFAFRRDSSKTPRRPIANWFLAGHAGSYLVTKLHQSVWKYWGTRRSSSDYFWFHGIFADLVTGDPEFSEIWQDVPEITCMHGFHFPAKAPRLAAPPTSKDMEDLQDPPGPVYKLTHKYSQECGPQSLLNCIIEKTTRPFERLAVHPHITLHVGLPKCGSSTLQHWANENRKELRSRSVLYPPVSRTAKDPKHQGLARAILTENVKLIGPLVAPVSEDKLFLSAEGITNHFFDLEARPWLKAKFRSCFRQAEITVLMIKRNRDAWRRSYHQQQVVNPPDSRYLHGTALTQAQLVEQPRVKRIDDWEVLLMDVCELLNAKKFVVCDLDKDWAKAVTGALGVDDLAQSLSDYPRKNTSLSASAVELIRQANAMNLGAGRRAMIMQLRFLEKNPDRKSKKVGGAVSVALGNLSDKQRSELLQVTGALTASSKEQEQLVDGLKAAFGTSDQNWVGIP